MLEPGEDGGIEASVLLQNRRELVIRHGGERYILRLTSNNKLILTK